MTAVEANERKAEAIQKDYLYNEKVHEEDMDSRDSVKKTKTTEREFFSIDGVPVLTHHRTGWQTGLGRRPEEGR